MDKLLVALQFGIVSLLLIWAIIYGAQPVASAVPIILLAASLVMGVWSVVANKPGNFNIVPMPKAGASLITSGPYRWIHHPMYTSVLLFGLACATVIDNALGWMGWIALLAVLWVKASLEEKYLTDAYEAYETYMLGTRRFIPWIF